MTREARARRTIERLLERAEVRVGGSRPYDIEVHDERLFARVLREGLLGLGEAYMDGWWDAPRLDVLFDRLLRAGVDGSGLGLAEELRISLAAALFNLQRRARAARSVSSHYDLGNDLFEAMLDRRMNYSCAYWKDAESLDDAQEAKLDLVCRKIGLRAGHRLLDIGCGWGAMARFAAEEYGASVVGITLSRAQAAVARECTQGLPVEIRVEDYRETRGTFDRIVSIGMFEHVGPKNYRTYMRAVSRLLRDDGLFLLHTIGSLRSRRTVDAWLAKYIFPDGVIPSIRQLGGAFEGLLTMEDWHNFGADYDLTLMAWHDNLERRWDTLPAYDARFRRMWRYYLLQCAGGFRARHNQLWQIVLARRGVDGGYRSIR